MKKFLTTCFAALGFFFAASAAHADDNTACQSNACPEPKAECCAPCPDQPCGESYQLYCHYEPCYYNEWHTVCEPKVVRKKCCRYVPKQYEKCCVKYVPQYYTQTCCRYEPEYYYVDETKNVTRKVCQQKCKYVPKYYYKHVCDKNACDPCQAK